MEYVAKENDRKVFGDERRGSSGLKLSSGDCGNGAAAYGGGGAAEVVSIPNQTPQRRYLPTLSDLVDRLTIVQLKSVFITKHTEAYVKERKDIEHDIDLILTELAAEGKRITATEIHAIIVIMLSNRFIWESESKARAGGSEQDRLLKLTHSINGVRNTAKNQLANIDGGRRDYKTDCFASELIADFGNWKIFE